MSNKVYIYNLDQANYYIAEGLEVLECGKGSRGDFFVCFKYNDRYKEAFNKWCSK